MKNYKLCAISCLIIFGLMSACVHTQSLGNKSWQDKMKGFASSLIETLPLIHKKAMLTMEERSTLAKNTDAFLSLSRSVNHSEGMPSTDMAFEKNAAALEVELVEIKNNLQAGKDELAKQRLKSVTNYCISCHSLREGYETTFDVSFVEKDKKLTNKDRAEFFAAIRQFDKAIIYFEYALVDESLAKNDPEAWNMAALQLLAIVVRVKNNPNLSLEMISRFFDTKAYPSKMRDVARIWRKEIVKWEKSENKTPTAIDTASVYKLIGQSEALEKQMPRAGLIQDLRASRILHFLKTTSAKTHPSYQKWLLFSGDVATRLQDLNLWDHPGDYYVACVRQSPLSLVGKECAAKAKAHAN